LCTANLDDDAKNLTANLEFASKQLGVVVFNEAPVLGPRVTKFVEPHATAIMADEEDGFVAYWTLGRPAKIVVSIPPRHGRDTGAPAAVKVDGRVSSVYVPDHDRSATFAARYLVHRSTPI
jgi:hypothetical protein